MARPQRPPRALMSMDDALTVSMSYLLRQAALRAQSEVSHSLARMKLRAPHHAVLTTIAPSPRSQVELAERLQTDRTTMVAIVDDLERMALVERRPRADDRRAHDVTLTRAGRRALARSQARLREVDLHLLAALEPREVAQLRKLLLRVIASYDQREREDRLPDDS